jgi:hypothetical protein
LNAALLAALIAVESGGNDLAVGDNGRAIGPLQIHPGVVADVNRHFGTSYTHAGMTNRADACEVCRRYLSIYATPTRLGRPVTAADEARIWNGGPNGYRRASTLPYLQKVQSHKP